MKKPSKLEKKMLFRIKLANLPLPETEYCFCPGRRWRFDFAWPEIKLAAECEGAVWSQGRHTRGSGFIADCRKYNTAAVMGWTVLRYTDCMLHEAIEDITTIISKQA